MALRPDRDYYAQDSVLWYFDEAAEAGHFVVQKTGGGPTLDDPNNVAEVSASAAGKTVVGILLQDVVDVDTTRVNKSSARGEAFVGDKVSIATYGWFVTDKILAGQTPANGDIAVLTDNGEIRVAPASWDPDDNPKVGHFGSTKDAEGFARVFVDIQPVSGQLSS